MFEGIKKHIQLDEFHELFVANKGLLIDEKNWAYEKNGYLFLGLDSCIEMANNGRYDKATIQFANIFS